MLVFLFCMFRFLFCLFRVFVMFCALFLPTYIAVYFILVYNFTDHCHRVELQLINNKSYNISYHNIDRELSKQVRIFKETVYVYFEFLFYLRFFITVD